MLLRNFDFAVKYLDYESKTELENTSGLQISGWYKFTNGILSALLVKNNRLYFLYNDKMFLIMESHRVLLSQAKNQIENEFSLVGENGTLVKFLYTTADPKLNISPFEYIDDGDFKWEDFIANIINDENRKSNFVTNIMESN